jgi:glycosyltransferase involved in cell wall biosynthesis
MRLAILQQSYGRFGGAERLFFSHYVQMKKMGRDVTAFYTGRIADGWAERLKGEAIQPMPSGISSDFRRFKHLMGFLSNLRDFDKILIHHHVEPILAYYISKFLGARTIWYSGSMFELPWQDVITGLDYRRISPTVGKTSTEFYGPLISRLLLSNGLYRITTRVAKAIDISTVRGYGKVLANSVFLSKFLTHVYNLKETPEVVYPGADPLFEQLASKPQAVEQDYMLAVGSLVPLKNFESIIRAAAAVPTSKLVFVGDGQDRSKLKDIATKLDVPVEFRGNFDQESDLAKAYSECKFLVLLSLYETFGLTPVEAGLFSKPSIVTSSGGPQEVVQDGITGFVVNPIDYESVGEKMNLLLKNDSLRRAMGNSARKKIMEDFSLEKSTNRLVEEIES